MHIAGVPAEETGARFDNFVHGTPADQIYTLVEGWSRSQGENAKFLALLSSQKGIGKTRLAISAMAEYFVDHAGIHLVMKNGQLAPYVTDKTFIFLKERDLLMKLRASYGNDEDYNEQDIMKELYAVDFLVLDDILANKKSDFDRQILLNILDHRMDAVDKRTVFTSNHNLKDIVSFEDRIGSRLQDVHKGCVLTIETLRIPDYRVIRRGVGGEEERNVICL
jgi:DNA replication protein DnaC